MSQTAQRCSRVGARAEAVFQPLVSFVNRCAHSGLCSLDKAIRSSRDFFSSLTPLFPENHHEQVPFPFAAPCHEPKHASSQATTLVETPQEHTTQSGQDQSKAFERRRQASISLLPAKSARAAWNFAEPEVLGNKSPKSRTILARSSITGEESLEEQGVRPR